MSSEKEKAIAHKPPHRYIVASVAFPLAYGVGLFLSWPIYTSDKPRDFWWTWLLGLLAIFALVNLVTTLAVDGWVRNKSLGVTVLHAAYLVFLSVCVADNPKGADAIVILYIGLFTVVELITDGARCYDVYHGRSGPEWDRWWICTMIYPACGLLLEVTYWFDTPQIEVNQLYSVLAGFLSCTYMLSVYSQRLVPSDGPFKEIHGVSSGDRPRSGEGTS